MFLYSYDMEQQYFLMEINEVFNIFIRDYSFEDLTFIITFFLIINILSVISHDFKYPIGCR